MSGRDPIQARGGNAAAGDPPPPNPEAIAWYVEEAQRLLEDQQRRAESLRTRGGQVAGFAAAVLALIGGNANDLVASLDGVARVVADVCLLAAAFCLAAAVMIAIWGALRPRAFAGISAEEIVTYTSDPFLTEVDLWRVHVRSLYAIYHATADAEETSSLAVKAVERSFVAFLMGLGFSLLAIATLLVELI
jgi:hypothetical protein